MRQLAIFLLLSPLVSAEHVDQKDLFLSREDVILAANETVDGSEWSTSEFTANSSTSLSPMTPTSATVPTRSTVATTTTDEDTSSDEQAEGSTAQRGNQSGSQSEDEKKSSSKKVIIIVVTMGIIVLIVLCVTAGLLYYFLVRKRKSKKSTERAQEAEAEKANDMNQKPKKTAKKDEKAQKSNDYSQKKRVAEEKKKDVLLSQPLLPADATDKQMSQQSKQPVFEPTLNMMLDGNEMEELQSSKSKDVEEKKK